MVSYEDKYNEIFKELQQLKNEYSENTIIQSMNEMRDRYNQLLDSSVPDYKYQGLYEKWYKLHRAAIASLVLTEHVTDLLKNLEEKLLYDRDNSIIRSKFELQTIKELLENVIRKPQN